MLTHIHTLPPDAVPQGRCAVAKNRSYGSFASSPVFRGLANGPETDPALAFANLGGVHCIMCGALVCARGAGKVWEGGDC